MASAWMGEAERQGILGSGVATCSSSHSSGWCKGKRRTYRKLHRVAQQAEQAAVTAVAEGGGGWGEILGLGPLDPQQRVGAS